MSSVAFPVQIKPLFKVRLRHDQNVTQNVNLWRSSSSSPFIDKLTCATHLQWWIHSTIVAYEQ